MIIFYNERSELKGKLKKLKKLKVDKRNVIGRSKERKGNERKERKKGGRNSVLWRDSTFKGSMVKMKKES